jgi:hypothetical protein
MQKQILPVVPVPVTITVVALCDVRVLVRQLGNKIVFPSGYFVPGRETCQERASFILKEALHGFRHSPSKWIPVDIRSKSRINEDGLYTLDIGYMSVLETHDLPFTSGEEYKWQEANLDSGAFPAILGLDHVELWRATSELFGSLHS